MTREQIEDDARRAQLAAESASAEAARIMQSTDVASELDRECRSLAQIYREARLPFPSYSYHRYPRTSLGTGYYYRRFHAVGSRRAKQLKVPRGWWVTSALWLADDGDWGFSRRDGRVPDHTGWRESTRQGSGPTLMPTGTIDSAQFRVRDRAVELRISYATKASRAASANPESWDTVGGRFAELAAQAAKTGRYHGRDIYAGG